MHAQRIRCARVYDEVSPADGRRVLVDRLWPRGVRKDSPALDEWIKEAAPSSELRTWYAHDPARFAEFRDRYRQELDTPGGRRALNRLRELATEGTLTLLTSGKHLALSHIQVLADELEGEGGASPRQPGHDLGGDPACWMARVCPECGRLADEDPPTTCRECGAAIPAE